MTMTTTMTRCPRCQHRHLTVGSVFHCPACRALICECCRMPLSGLLPAFSCPACHRRLPFLTGAETLATAPMFSRCLIFMGPCDESCPRCGKRSGKIAALLCPWCCAGFCGWCAKFNETWTSCPRCRENLALPPRLC